MSQEQNDVYVLYHTTYANRLSSKKLQEQLDKLPEQLQGRFLRVNRDRRKLFQICSTSDDDAFEKIKDFALLCNEARQPQDRVDPVLPAFPGFEPGPSGAGTKSEFIWEARQHPLALKIAEHLKCLGWTAAPKLENWRPDIFFEKCGAPLLGKILIEVKPKCDMHNVITAIGQLLCYSLPLVNSPVILVLATNGEVKNNLAKALEHYAIKALDVAKDNWTNKLEALLNCSATPSTSRLKLE